MDVESRPSPAITPNSVAMISCPSDTHFSDGSSGTFQPKQLLEKDEELSNPAGKNTWKAALSLNLLQGVNTGVFSS